MARRRNPSGTWRCNLSFSKEVAERLRAHVASVDRRPTTAAAELLLGGPAAATGEAENELAALRRRNQELQDQVEALRRSRLDELNATEETDDDPPSPRWEQHSKGSGAATRQSASRLVVQAARSVSPGCRRS